MIGVFGISYHTAPVAIREKFSFAGNDATDTLHELCNAEDMEGAILLSTCNRTEIYFDTKTEDTAAVAKQLIHSLAAAKGETLEQNYYYLYTEEEAITHLFNLAAGLNSMVVGETQILGQIKDAFRLSNEQKLSSAMLSRLMHRAFEAAKKIRTSFQLSASPLSAGSAAVKQTLKHIEAPEEENYLVLGAGKMAVTVVEALRLELPKADIRVYNRTAERARKFAEKHNIPFYTNEQLPEAIEESSVLFVATSSLTPYITAETFIDREKKIFIFDLAVPRNVSEELKNDSRISLLGIDDLRNSGCSFSNPQTMREVQNCLQEMVDEFKRWQEVAKLSGLIQQINQEFDKVLEKDLSPLRKKLDEEEFALVEKHCTHLKISYSSKLIASLRKLHEKEADAAKYADALKKLLGVEES